MQPCDPDIPCPGTGAPERPGVLFIHGAGAGGWEWNRWRAVFEAAGRRCSAPDLMPATAGLADTRFGDYLDQVASESARLGGEPVLVGASLGGLLATALAARMQAKALVLVNPLPPAPHHLSLPARPPWPPVVPWGREATLAGTRRAMPDADEAACLYAFRRWRDESGQVLEAARAGLALAAPTCPVLAIASMGDTDVPATASAALAVDWGASLLRVEGSHVGPLLGRQAAAVAVQALAWLDAQAGSPP